MREIENKKDNFTKTKEICMQEFLKGGALSIDGLIEERAPPVIKSINLVFIIQAAHEGAIGPTGTTATFYFASYFLQ